MCETLLVLLTQWIFIDVIAIWPKKNPIRWITFDYMVIVVSWKYCALVFPVRKTVFHFVLLMLLFCSSISSEQFKSWKRQNINFDQLNLNAIHFLRTFKISSSKCHFEMTNFIGSQTDLKRALLMTLIDVNLECCYDSNHHLNK